MNLQRRVFTDDKEGWLKQRKQKRMSGTVYWKSYEKKDQGYAWKQIGRVMQEGQDRMGGQKRK